MGIETMVAIGGLVVAVITVLLTSRTNTRQDAAILAQLSIKMDTANTQLTNLQVDLRAMDKEQKELRERVARLEASCKSAHHRIDNMNENKEMD